MEHDHSVSPQSKKRTRKPKTQSLVVVSEVRRSSRVREKCNGFKTSQCKVANCLGCSVKPPIMTAELLKNIGSNLCQIPLDQLNEESLTKKKKTGTIGKKKTNSKASKDEEGDKKKSNQDVEED